MSLSKKDIRSLDVIGKSQDGAEIYHLVTKGGHHRMLKKTRKGDFLEIGSGAHRAVARFTANTFEKNILWHESLFKSEESEALKTAESSVMPESTESAHVAQSVWHTYKSTTGDAINKIYHTLRAVAHCQAAGLDKMKALEVANKTLKKLSKSLTMDTPYDEDLLVLAWEKKHKKPFPSGE